MNVMDVYLHLNLDIWIYVWAIINRILSYSDVLPKLLWGLDFNVHMKTFYYKFFNYGFYEPLWNYCFIINKVAKSTSGTNKLNELIFFYTQTSPHLSWWHWVLCIRRHLVSDINSLPLKPMFPLRTLAVECSISQKGRHVWLSG